MIVAAMQPCYLPWRGYFALLRACDVLVHLVDNYERLDEKLSGLGARIRRPVRASPERGYERSQSGGNHLTPGPSSGRRHAMTQSSAWLLISAGTAWPPSKGTYVTR